jgi:hypothetical protein
MTHTLKQRLHLDIDSINCWIQSVEEAIQALHHHETQQRLNSSRFFAPFYAAGRTNPTNQFQEIPQMMIIQSIQTLPALPQPRLPLS